jgi:hypothetical protein
VAFSMCFFVSVKDHIISLLCRMSAVHQIEGHCLRIVWKMAKIMRLDPACEYLAQFGHSFFQLSSAVSFL